MFEAFKTLVSRLSLFLYALCESPAIELCASFQQCFGHGPLKKGAEDDWPSFKIKSSVGALSISSLRLGYFFTFIILKTFQDSTGFALANTTNVKWILEIGKENG